MGRAPRILVAAGEPSGDLHGGPVIAALRARMPGVEIEAVGGPRMAAAVGNGAGRVRFRMDPHTVMGFAEIPRALPAHWRLLRALERDFHAGRYDLALLIDYPGFNLRVAEAAKRNRVRVVYYIAPKQWASGTRHTARFAAAVDRLAVIIPFEPEFFARHGIRAEYVGHPLLDRPPAPPRQAARRSLGLGDADRVLALFPGSRTQEIARLWPPFREAARRLRAAGSCDRVVVAGVGAVGASYPGAEGFLIRQDEPELVLAAADAAIVKSGTATLEAALAGVPMVVAYRVHWLTAWLAKRVITVPWISLVNLIAGREVVPELLQGEASADRLAKAVEPLLHSDHPAVQAQREGFRQVRARLGERGLDAPAGVAAMAAELLW